MRLSYKQMKELEEKIITNPEILDGILTKQNSAVEKQIVCEAVVRLKNQVKGGFLPKLGNMLKEFRHEVVTLSLSLIAIISIIAFSIGFISTEVRINRATKSMLQAQKKVEVHGITLKSFGERVVYLESITKPLKPLSKIENKKGSKNEQK